MSRGRAWHLRPAQGGGQPRIARGRGRGASCRRGLGRELRQPHGWQAGGSAPPARTRVYRSAGRAGRERSARNRSSSVSRILHARPSRTIAIARRAASFRQNATDVPVCWATSWNVSSLFTRDPPSSVRPPSPSLPALARPARGDHGVSGGDGEGRRQLGSRASRLQTHGRSVRPRLVRSRLGLREGQTRMHTPGNRNKAQRIDNETARGMSGTPNPGSGANGRTILHPQALVRFALRLADGGKRLPSPKAQRTATNRQRTPTPDTLVGSPGGGRRQTECPRAPRFPSTYT